MTRRRPNPMDRASALRKWRALRRMTVARGCTPAEARTSADLAASIARRYGFTEADADEPRSRRPAPEPATSTAGRHDEAWERAYARRERTAAGAWAWEYRKCGKGNCWCASAPQGHGPYKYGKRREGKTVRSIYLGK